MVLIRALKEKVQSALGVEIRLALATEPLSEADLSENERKVLSGFKSNSRRRSWLTGRRALKSLEIQESTPPFASSKGESIYLLHPGNRDTHELIFPNAGLSITHSGGLAIAAKVNDQAIIGLGIDLEIGRSPKPESIRFYLSKEEQAWIKHFDEIDSKELRLRLWTIKEALFKANTGERFSLFQYELEAPGELKGKAGPGKLEYAAFEVPGGYFSAAIMKGN